jgi:hypothetical protein
MPTTLVFDFAGFFRITACNFGDIPARESEHAAEIAARL